MIIILLYQIAAYTIHGKVQRSHIRTTDLKYHLQHGMKNLNYLMDHILYYKTVLNLSLKNGENIINPSIRIYGNKIEYRIMFKIKTGNYLELLTAEKKKLLGSNKSKKTKNENGENVPHLGITEVVLVHCNI